MAFSRLSPLPLKGKAESCEQPLQILVSTKILIPCRGGNLPPAFVSEKLRSFGSTKNFEKRKNAIVAQNLCFYSIYFLMWNASNSKGKAKPKKLCFAKTHGIHLCSHRKSSFSLFISFCGERLLDTGTLPSPFGSAQSGSSGRKPA